MPVRLGPRKPVAKTARSRYGILQIRFAPLGLTERRASTVGGTTMATKETKQAYSPGLAGVIAGETQICWVDPNAGLMYRGYDIHEMAEKASFEEVAYLLLNGELPNGKQLAEFTRQIAAEREV